MKISKILVVLLTAALIVSCKSKTEQVTLIGNWAKLGDFDGDARSGAATFTVGSDVYIFAGYNEKSLQLNNLWKYNATDKTWKEMAKFPGKARAYAVGFGINGKGYIGLGTDGISALSDFWEYDPQANKWDSITTPFIGTARYHAVASAIGNTAYIGTGYDGGSNLKSFYSFTPTGVGTGTWTEISSYEGSKRRGAVSFVLNNKMYLLGGSSNSSNPIDFQSFDPSTGKWTKIADLRNTDLTTDDDAYDNIPRADGVAFVINNKAYVCTGTTNSSQNTKLFEYDPNTNKWTEKNGLTHRVNAVAFNIGNRGFVATGASGGKMYDDFWEFFPDAADNKYD